ncbi:MAG: 2OG-Fe(II) oxygenase [Myxococcales bacterium]|nr:2OG-Fe(II) oxygenase [Myxococcales bacterium]MCB9568127.1 2OG-Fe(II) oxygenase [Myxococcales bacterium]
MYAGFLDLTQPPTWIVDDALPAERCAAFIARFRGAAPELAPIIGRDGRPTIEPATRNNTRVMWDDPAEADGLLDLVRPAVPTRLMGLALVGANPRLRLYRYGPGERHGAHWDSVVELDDGRRSLLTLVFYLNEGFVGGDTDFPELGKRITPRLGRALLFQHRILHRACEVEEGEKFVLRTDIFYRAR